MFPMHFLFLSLFWFPFSSSSSIVEQTPLILDDDLLPPKLVVAHFMVGNTYPYSYDDWTRDITLAAAKGIDAFALNLGRDDWQPARISDAYAAAQRFTSSGAGSFKLFLSFDMSSLPCSGYNDANLLQYYIRTYNTHPNQLMYNNKMLVSTFSGQNCYFGTGSVNDGWNVAVKNWLPPVHFVPSFFVDPATFSSLPVMDGAFNWNGGWPMGNSNITFDSDASYISNLPGRSYMAPVSPWFFTHYGPDTYNKNFIYRGDNWLLAERWEMLIQHRSSINLAQVITWNDYGESHYIGPIEGAQPNSQAWVNGFDHQGWLDLNHYYITAFKTGAYPRITKDRIFLWARLYPALANANDYVGKPTNYQFTEDYLWAVVFLSSPAQVTIFCGSSYQTSFEPAGLSKLRLPLVQDCEAVAYISRGNTVSLVLSPPGFKFRMNPPSYNFNAFVAASPP